MKTTSATQICVQAAELTSSARARSHGRAEVNLANIADLWNGYLEGLLRTRGDPALTPSDVASLNELQKIARRLTGELDLDDYIDAAGYAGLAGELAQADEQERAANLRLVPRRESSPETRGPYTGFRPGEREFLARVGPSQVD